MIYYDDVDDGFVMWLMCMYVLIDNSSQKVGKM